MEDQAAALLATCSPEIRTLAGAARNFLRRLLPDAQEEVDEPARLIAYTYQPGTYKGLIVAIALHQAHINLMFARGADLLTQDPTALLEGTGKKARHVKIATESRLSDPDLATLVTAAAAAAAVR
ncbi:DUF1801 domain-containing protein [Nonomuraea sp. NPDC050547]|uniref:DUF1801 domain-containing protein n=1 Tax=Nonomuraea sp. NPDC050547 TaxID=3364368 RepID=UPI0037ABD6A1